MRLLPSAATMLALGLSSAVLPAAAEPLKVIATFSILGDLASNVGGDRIALTTLVPPGGDAHVFEPRPSDAATMADADIVLMNGLGLEGFIARLVETSGTKAAVIEVAKGTETLEAGDDEHGHAGQAHDSHGHDGAHDAKHDHDHDEDRAEADDHDHGPMDPHAWQSVHNVETYVDNIARAFCAADAAGCATYEANAAAYSERLEALEDEIEQAVARIPTGKRVIITSHDAFGYFAHAYGIRFLAPRGVSTEAEASAADVAALIRQIREDKASAIFVESISDPRLVEQIAAETGVKVGGELYSDALSGPDGPAPTYIDMMRHNISTIAGAIQGS